MPEKLALPSGGLTSNSVIFCKILEVRDLYHWCLYFGAYIHHTWIKGPGMLKEFVWGWLISPGYLERCAMLYKGYGGTWRYSMSGIWSPAWAGVEIAAAAAASHAQPAPENFLEEKRRCSFSGWALWPKPFKDPKKGPYSAWKGAPKGTGPCRCFD